MWSDENENEGAQKSLNNILNCQSGFLHPIIVEQLTGCHGELSILRTVPLAYRRGGNELLWRGMGGHGRGLAGNCKLVVAFQLTPPQDDYATIDKQP